MSTTAILVRRCAAGDREAWEVLLRIVGDARSMPIRRLLLTLRIDPALADDLDQELFLYLIGPGAARLRAFRGTSGEQFRRYLAVLAVRFARTRLARMRRRDAREARARRAHARALGRPGPTEAEILAALEDLGELLDGAGRAHLLALLAPGGSPDVPARTRRRWAGELARCLDEAGEAGLVRRRFPDS